MEITAAVVELADAAEEPRLRAYVTVLIEGGGLALEVDGIRVVEPADGRFMVAWPSKRVKGISADPRDRTFLDDDRQPFHFKDVVHPHDPGTRRRTDAVILDAYAQALDSGSWRHTVRLPGRRATA